MSVRVDQGVIHLEGACPVGDAEPLLSALQNTPLAIIDFSGATKLHLAVIQLLLAVLPPVCGVPPDPFLRDHVLPLLRQVNAEDTMPDQIGSV